jgi:hypothetical protein
VGALAAARRVSRSERRLQCATLFSCLTRVSRYSICIYVYVYMYIYVYVYIWTLRKTRQSNTSTNTTTQSARDHILHFFAQFTPLSLPRIIWFHSNRTRAPAGRITIQQPTCGVTCSAPQRSQCCLSSPRRKRSRHTSKQQDLFIIYIYIYNFFILFKKPQSSSSLFRGVSEVTHGSPSLSIW